MVYCDMCQAAAAGGGGDADVLYCTVQCNTVQDDYVQFGRDILFITSYRSDKFCHRIQVSTVQCSTVQYWSVQCSTLHVTSIGR